VDRYRRRLSGPLRDRFDLAVEVQAVPWQDLRGDSSNESSAAVKARVVAARRRQLERQGLLNAQLDGRRLRQVCRISDRSDALLGRAVTRLGLSARAITRVLRVARTVADLDSAPELSDAHLAEALQFRLMT
jgi:magnesium chelatase family protein